jgi:asparagine synthase (glutamine-hydrolysing)
MAEKLGLPKEFSWRKKVAAQYGSGVDKNIGNLAKRKGFKYKKDYLESLLKNQI